MPGLLILIFVVVCLRCVVYLRVSGAGIGQSHKAMEEREPACHYKIYYIHYIYIHIYIIYRVVFLTGPPHFQYQNEKQVAANQD